MSELETVLESLVDQHTLGAVLAAIETVVREKAEHIATNWQDERYAAHWLRAANEVERCRGHVIV